MIRAVFSQIVGKYAVVGALAATLAIGAYAAIQTMRLNAAKQGIMVEKANHERTISNYRKAQAEWESRYRLLEQQFHANEEQDNAQREKERAEHAARLAALQRDTDKRLRNGIAEYAASSRRAAEDTVAACRERASTLGVLLEEALRAEEELTGAIELANTDIRRLLRRDQKLSALLQQAQIPIPTDD